MWCSHHKITTHNDADCRATTANGPNGNAHFAQVCPPSVPGICSSWDLTVRDDSDVKLCISLLAREVQPAAKPAKAPVEVEKGARPFGPVQTAATEGWITRPWPFTPRIESQLVTKSAKARVEEKGARPFGPVSTTSTEGWRTRLWPFTPRTGQTISIGRQVAEETFGMVNDEEPTEKALMASSSVRGSIIAFVRGSINAFVRGSINAEWRKSVARNSATFAGRRAGYCKNGVYFTQQQDSLAQRHHAACCRGADGCGNPLQGSTPQQK